MDRTELARAWAKCIAFVACGKLPEASKWAQKLVDMLRDQGVVIS